MVEAVEGILKSIETDSRRNLEGQLDLFGVGVCCAECSRKRWNAASNSPRHKGGM